MTRWLKTAILVFFALVFLAGIKAVAEDAAHAETALLLDTSSGKPLFNSRTIFTNAPLNMQTVSRTDVYSDPSKLSNIGAYRIAVLYAWGGRSGQQMPDWCKNSFNSYISNGGILIGTGFDEVSGGYSGGGDDNFMEVFHLEPGNPIDIMTNTRGWTARVVAGQENHPIANGPYGSYSGSFTTNGFTDADGAHAKSDGTEVFQLKNWITWGGGGDDWLAKITVWQTSSGNDGTAIWWNGNGNGNNEVVGEWTGGVMVPAFQNMMYWAMGLAGFELTISTDAPTPSVGFPNPQVGVNATPRNFEITCQVQSPWNETGVLDERFVCTGYTGDGTVVPATGDTSSVTFTMTGNGTLVWHWKKEYRIDVTSSQQIGAPATEYTVWKESGRIATETTTNFVQTADPDIGWRLSGWIGTGSVPASGIWQPQEDPTLSWFCDGAGSIEWQWTQAYRFRVFNPRNVGSPDPPTGDTFFDQGTDIVASVQDLVYESSSVRYLSDGFDGTGAVPPNGLINTVTFTLYTPSTITWKWKNEYRLDILNPTGLGSPNPEVGYEWYPQDAQVVCSINSPISHEGDNYVAVGYYLNEVGHFFDNLNNPSVTVTMSGPNRLQWIVQPSDIHLIVASPYGSPEPPVGDHIYTFNDEVTLDVDAIVLGPDESTRYVCTGFIGTGEGVPELWKGFETAEGKDFEYTFQMKTSPTTITWTWKTEYLLTMQSTEPNTPSIPALGSHWMASGSTVFAGAPRFISGFENIGFFVTEGGLSPSTRNHATFTMEEPITILWNWEERAIDPLYPVQGGIQSISDADPNWGRFASLATDELTSNPHIAFYRSYDDGGGSLYYTFYNGIEWIMELVDGRNAANKVDMAGTPDVGQYASIQLDTNGRPHIAYFDNSNGTLRYAYRTVGGNWIIQTVDDGGGGIVGEFCSLLLNKFNEPNIAYYNRTNGNLQYAYMTSEGWEIVVPAIIGNVGSSAKIALDPVTQRPRIVYRDNDTNNLYFVYDNGTEWVRVTVDDEGTAGNTVGIAIDTKGVAHIVYQSFLGDINRLMYAVQGGDNFFVETIEEGEGTGYFPSIALLEGDFPLVTFNDQTAHALRYAFFDGNEWHLYTLDDNGESVGWYTALSVLNDMVQIAYWTSEGLRYTTLQHKATSTQSSDSSDGGGGGGGGGCFVATAAFGSYASGTVTVLTGVRHSALASAGTGSSLVSLYYIVSPSVANEFATAGNTLVRRMLDKLVK
ncbi:MAG: CFI-box-CTERM domain-containing protein [Planctomycetota bacterium]|nr:CFI-box-CTERM domain-containing protein [Planctomycetota bacterium]